MGNSEREENLMLEMMFALAGMFFFGALTGWIADHLPERLAEWMEIHIFPLKKKMISLLCRCKKLMLFMYFCLS